MNYQRLRTLLDWCEQYEQEFPDRDFQEAHFRTWLSESPRSENNADTPMDQEAKTERRVAMLLAFMYKYAAFYGRRLFKNNIIYSFDDFAILATLFPDHKLSKTEVMRVNIMEKSSGNEVLKRMLKKGLLTETEHPKDKRSKLIALTDQGRQALQGVETPIRTLSLLISGNLTIQEKHQLLHLLNKLHEFHNPIFELENTDALNQRLGLS